LAVVVVVATNLVVLQLAAQVVAAVADQTLADLTVLVLTEPLILVAVVVVM
jgi:hypothetical protein